MSESRDGKDPSSDRSEQGKGKGKKGMMIVLFLLSILALGVSCFTYFQLMMMRGQLNRMEMEVKSAQKQYMEMAGLDEGLSDPEGEELVREGKRGDGAGETDVFSLPEEEEEFALKKVCLTFDDGPSVYTDQILDILEKYGIKATFFVNYHKGMEERYQRIVREGHTLGMHSYSHEYGKVYGSLDSFAEDLYQLQDYLRELTGVTSKYYRFPGGSSNDVSKTDMKRLISYLDAKEIVYYDWNVSSQDAVPESRSATSIAQDVLKQIRALKSDTAVVLMHDTDARGTTVEALPLIIEGVMAMDNTVFTAIDDTIVPVQHLTITRDEEMEYVESLN